MADGLEINLQVGPSCSAWSIWRPMNRAFLHTVLACLGRALCSLRFPPLLQLAPICLARKVAPRLGCRLSPPQATLQNNVTDEEWRVKYHSRDSLLFLCSRCMLAWVYLQRVALPKGYNEGTALDHCESHERAMGGSQLHCNTLRGPTCDDRSRPGITSTAGFWKAKRSILSETMLTSVDRHHAASWKHTDGLGQRGKQCISGAFSNIGSRYEGRQDFIVIALPR